MWQKMGYCSYYNFTDGWRCIRKFPYRPVCGHIWTKANYSSRTTFMYCFQRNREFCIFLAILCISQAYDWFWYWSYFICPVSIADRAHSCLVEVPDSLCPLWIDICMLVFSCLLVIQWLEEGSSAHCLLWITVLINVIVSTHYLFLYNNVNLYNFPT